ncbi:VOC family protein [Pseudonocardia pini]|uniref:VOC family protein n=1 Tax=Pseudonocardia pini TaxID=2758030 RepID=UPI0015F014E6|nr:VOC family protein [Pseudonocardia pini]
MTAAEGPGRLTVDHIGIVVDDLDEAVAFLRDVLGLTIDEIFDVGPAGRGAMVAAGPVHLELVEYAQPERRREGLRGGTARIEHIAFDVADAERAHAALTARGVEVEGGLRVRSDCTTFFTTPESCDGVMYQFREATGD